MKTIGIVAEFNPFHNGHQYLIDTAKKALGAECVVAVMSGNFTQRGEIASFDMYSRADVASRNGVDLILEIPPQFVLNSAQYYAYYSVYILEQLGCIDYLVFGSECGDLSQLQALQNPDRQTLKIRMKTGITYAKAISDSHLLNSANNILAKEYLSALQTLHSDMIPFTVKRIGVSHNEKNPNGAFASASYLRQKIRSKVDISQYLPEIPNGTPISENCILPILKYKLASASEDEMMAINNITEGLHRRMKAAREQDIFEELIGAIKCKRYPETRIRRALYCLLLDMKKFDELPSYTRVLAFSNRGKTLLRTMKKTALLPLFSRITQKDIRNHEQLRQELFANEIFSLIQNLSRKEVN